MDLFYSQYFKINKVALKFCGLWPYQSQSRRKINHTIFVIITYSMIFSMAAGIYSDLNSEFIQILETILALIFCLTGVLKCTILYNQRNQLKQLYEQIASDWEKLTNNLERDLVRVFLLEGRNAMLIAIIYSGPSFVLYLFATYLPRIFIKESSKHLQDTFPLYFKTMIIDENLYDLQVCVHAIITGAYIISVYISASATYISSVKYVCALYAIARHRIQHAVHRDNHNLGKLIEDTSIIPGLIKVVDMHRKAIRGIQMIERVFTASLFAFEASALITIAVLIFYLNYYQGNIGQMLRATSVLTVYIIYLFGINWSGELIIQSCNDIYVAAYNIHWYKLSTRARLFVLMIMRRSLKPAHLTAGTIVILSMENFATILKTAWSFSTILLTTQKTSTKENANLL